MFYFCYFSSYYIQTSCVMFGRYLVYHTTDKCDHMDIYGSVASGSGT